MSTPEHKATEAAKAPLRDDEFTADFLRGNDEDARQEVRDLQQKFQFDFITMGLAPVLGAPLKWVYDQGASSQRLHRITLAPGHGVGGIVLKSGRPMLFTDLDSQMDPREYSSFPIVFAEDLHSFCALPLRTEKRVAGVLLIGYRTADPAHKDLYRACIEYLDGRFCGFEVVSDNFSTLEQIREEDAEESLDVPHTHSSLINSINAQEEERRRISRELHDGVVQELLALMLKAELVKRHSDEDDVKLVSEIIDGLNRAMGDLRNISVDLRPSTLDDLGLRSALVSQGQLYEHRYGARIIIEGNLGNNRFDKPLETQVYRIIQEAMVNSCKYSGSDFVRVTLNQQLGWLTATIYDEGIGFDIDKPTIKGTGCGLEGMKERAKLIGATLDIQSKAGQTTITLTAPMSISNKKEHE